MALGIEPHAEAIATAAPFKRRSSKIKPGCMRRGLRVCVAFMKRTYSRPVIPPRASTSDKISRRPSVSAHSSYALVTTIGSAIGSLRDGHASCAAHTSRHAASAPAAT